MATISGTASNDTYNGTSSNDTLVGSGGSDSLLGNGGSDYLTYSSFGGFSGISGPITVTFGSSIYSGSVVKPTGNDTFSGIRGVFGTSAADTLIGSDASGANVPYSIVLQGSGGDDFIDGRKNTLNQASYVSATTNVIVNLQVSIDGSGNITGTASDGQGGTDTLRNLIRVQGSNFADTIIGSSLADQFSGSTGNDVYNGGGSLASDIIRYDSFQAGAYSVSVTAAAPTAGVFGGDNATVLKTALIGGGSSSTDSTTNVSQFRGTDGNDTFIGTTATYSFFSYRFRGDAGNDIFNGQGNSNNSVDYSGAASAVSVDLTAGTASDGVGGNDTLINVVVLRGSNFNDTLLGSASSDNFGLGDAGLHTINGRGGANGVRYYGTNNVTIDLGTTVSSDFGGYQGSISKVAGSDTLLNIANAQGGYGNDTILGTPGNNSLSGGQGSNSIDGRGGYDILNYQPFTGLDFPTHGATVNLGDGVSGSAINPWDGTDALQNIEAVNGSQFSDDLTGAVLASGLNSYVQGYGGNDIIRAQSLGTHVTADYLNSLAGVNVDLGAQQTTDDGWFGGTDTLINIQSVRGSAFADTLVGGTGNDTIIGSGGDDRINGKGGVNVLDGGVGDDTATFDFNLVDTTIAYDSLGRIVLTTTGAINTLVGFEHYQFADTTVNSATGSPLVDDLFYYIRNKDVFSAHIDPETHYNSFGYQEGRDPNAFFSTSGYLAANPDVKALGLNPLAQYDQYGWKEGRDPSAAFDTTLYLQHNPDVKALGVDPLAHYLQYGAAEGRQSYAAIGKPQDLGTHPGFDAAYYLLANPDIAKLATASGGDTFAFAYSHYEAYGYHEGRNPNAIFDVNGYLNAYADVKALGIDPLSHYEAYGSNEGRDPSANFDTKAYLANNPDVANAHIDPLLHYLQYGVYEGRAAYADGTFFHV